MSARSFVAACVLAAALGGASSSMAADQQPPDGNASELGGFMAEQLIAYQQARGNRFVTMPLDRNGFRVEVLDGKTFLERAAGKAEQQQVLGTADRLMKQAIVGIYQSFLIGVNPCCNCTTSATCNDGLFCNGAEICSLGLCAQSTVPCDDSNPCTNDSCTENTDTCSFTPVPPPPAVTRLDLSRSAPASTVATLAWTPVTGASAYNIYRSAFSNLGGLSCFQSNVAGTSSIDDGASPTVAFYFLVSSLACSESGLEDATAPSRPAPPGCP